MSSFDFVPLGDVTSSQKGKLPKDFSDEPKAGYLPYVDIKAFEKGVIERYAKVDKAVLTSQDDTLVVWDGSRFGLSGSAIEGVLGSTLMKVSSKTILSKFLLYFIKQHFTKINTKPRGTGTPHVDPELFWGLPVPVVDKATQQAIVSRIDQLFSQLDEGQKALQRAEAQLARYKQAVLKAAVSGELTREWREKNPVKTSAASLLKTIEATLSPKQKKRVAELATLPTPAGLGEIPDTWCWARLPQLGEFGRGKSKHRPRNDPKLFGGAYPFLQTGTVRNSSGWIKTYDDTYSDMGLAQSKLWPEGTVCITIAANIASSGILTFPACFPDSVVGLVCADGISNKYLEFFVRTARENLDRFAPATAQKNINLDILEQVCVPLPPPEEQEAIGDRVDNLMMACSKIEDTIRQGQAYCAKLRQSILHAAFSGQLVKETKA